MRRIRRLSAFLLVTVLIIAQLPVMALAATGEDPVPDSGSALSIQAEIIAFRELDAEIADQEVPLGTNQFELRLPDMLMAIVRTKSEPEAQDNEQEPAEDFAEPLLDDEGEETGGSETETMETPVPVTWNSSPEYDRNTAGTYTFVAEIEGFALGAEPPVITVTVTEAALKGTVVALAELPGEIRWQNTIWPVFPETVSGMVEDKLAQIPVAWAADRAYNSEYPERGLYVFDAVLAEGYTLASSLQAPRITVYIPETVGRFGTSSVGGSGTDGSPLEITTAAQLAEIAELVNLGRLESFLFNNSAATVYLQLQNDLDLSAYGKSFNGGKGWRPIGASFYQPFKGHFSGGGKTITGLYINDKESSSSGLFSYIHGGSVQKLGVEGADINGSANVGGIAGQIENALVKNCGVTGSISGSINAVGGVVGSMENSIVENCYFAGSVESAGSSVGGIAGELSTNSAVQNCYSTATVKGFSRVGGIIGCVNSGTIKDCAALGPAIIATSYPYGRVAGQTPVNTLTNTAAFSGMLANGSTVTSTDSTHINGADITAAAIKMDGTIGNRFIEDNGWAIADGRLPGFGKAIKIPDYMVDSTIDSHFPGEGTEENPYLIATAEKLALLATLVNDGETNAAYGGADVHYKLIADIDLSGYNSGKGWVPIGRNNTYSFKGNFDGNGKTITGLYINDSTRDYAGLFGCVSGSPGTVKNLELLDVNIRGKDFVGGAAGYVTDDGSIEDCSVTGQVAGGMYVGGVTGYAFYGGSVKNCHASGEVSGTIGVGGVVGGVTRGSSLETCYATSTVCGTSNVGGIAGEFGDAVSGSSLKNCYATGSVSGKDYVGGVVGTVGSGSTVDSCYATGTVSGTGYPVGGIAGRISTADSGVTNCAALNPSVSGSYHVGRVLGYNNGNLGTLSANVALSGMEVKENGIIQPVTGTATDKHGADRTAAEISADTGNCISGLFIAANGWTYETGKLPILTDFAGQDSTLPYHISGGYFSGDGLSEATAYQISTAAQLAKLAELVNSDDVNTRKAYNSKYYKLMNDIDLSDYGVSNPDFNYGWGWIPIGNVPNTFNGHFNGNYKSVTGLYINNRALSYAGLFGYIYNGSLQNLGVVGMDIAGGDAFVGGVVGVLGGTIQNCYATGTVAGKDYVGGLLGALTKDSTAQNCYTTGCVSGNLDVGGVVGSVEGTLQNCYATATVNGSAYVGGVVGFAQGNAVIQNCYATGAVSSDSSYSGGVAGVGQSGCTIKNCVGLNLSVKATNESGRVIGSATATLASNYAFSGMRVNGKIVPNGTADNKNGADLMTKQALDSSFWTTAASWDTSAWSDDVWSFQDGKLPVLSDLPGQSSDGGVYLIERDIASATVQVTGNLTYTGDKITPTVIVIFDSTTLVKDKDYSIAITSRDGDGTSAGTNAGAVELLLTGMGNFKGERTDLTYTIQPKALIVASVTVQGDPLTYNGAAQEPTVTVQDGGITLTVGKDYEVAYFNHTDAGTADVEVTGKGNYKGTVYGDFTILPKPVTITPDGGQSRKYGEADPVLTFANDGGLDASAFEGYLSRAAGKDVGAYAISLGTLSAGNNYTLALALSAVNFTIEHATVKRITTLLPSPSRTAYEARNATDAQAVVNLAGLPASVSIATDTDIATTLPIAWATSTPYNAKGAVYAVIGTLTGNSNISAGSVTGNVTITIYPVTAINPTFSDTTVVESNAKGATAAELGETVLPAGGNITVAGEAIAYTVDWNGGQTLDRTGVGNEQTFTGIISYTSPPAWLTLPSDPTVSRKVTVTAKTLVTIGGITTPDKAYDGVVYTPTGSVTVSDRVVSVSDLTWLYESTDDGSYSSATAPTNAGRYKLTVSVPESNIDYTGSQAYAFAIAKRPVVVNADDKSMTRGGTLPTFTYTVEGQLAGETALAGTPILTSATDGKTAGSFPITVDLSGVSYTANYTAAIPDFVNGTLTVSNPSSGGGGDGGGGSYTPAPVEPAVPERQPGQPVMAAAPITATAGAGGSASAAIPDKVITDAIAKAQAEAKAQGKTIDDIAIELNISMPHDADSLSVTLSQSALQSLIRAGVTSLQMSGAPVALGLDLSALQEIQRQSTGAITISIVPVTELSAEAQALIGNRPVYSITITYVKDGKTVELTGLGSGTAILSIPYIPGENETAGYLFGVYVDANGNAARIARSAYDANSSSVLVPTDHFSVYGVGYTAPSGKFTDIGSHWGKESIDFVVARGLLSGASKTAFAPDTGVTRGILATALGKLAVVDVSGYKTSSFTDVAKDDESAPYIQWAFSKGIMQGIGNRKFAPNKAVTREEMALIVASFTRALGHMPPITRELVDYADVASIGSEYKTAVTTMQQAGIIMGMSNNHFNPQANITRAQAAAILHRYAKLSIDPLTAQGWTVNDDGQFFYYEDGKALTGVQAIAGKEYHFSDTGVLEASVKQEIRLQIGRLIATVGGKQYTLDAAPYVEPNSGRTLVPIRFVSEMLSSEVVWRTASQQVVITEQGNEITLTIGSTSVQVNGEMFALDCPAVIVNSRAFVPLRFVSETLGALVHWNGAEGSISITR